MARAKKSIAAKDRNKVICQMLRIRGRMSVAELQDLLGVSDMTVRRCLNEMAEDGLIRRIHGGAVSVNIGQERLFNVRSQENYDYKVALAREAVEFVSPDSSIYLDGGTTCYEIARLLPPDRKCFVVTDSIAITRELRDKPGPEAILLGGQLADDDNTLDGPLAAENASKMTVETAIFSTGAFNTVYLENAGLTSMLTKKVIIEKAQRAICVADSDKLNKLRFIRFCDWDQVDVFITDDRLPGDARSAIEAAGVEVRLVTV